MLRFSHIVSLVMIAVSSNLSATKSDLSLEYLRTAKKNMSLQASFTQIYENNFWKNPESASGHGSTVKATEALQSELSLLLRKLEVKRLLDAPCGDFNWMRLVDLQGIYYIGVDIVNVLIEKNKRLYRGPYKEFKCLNLASDPLPQADLILCRDLLVHLPDALVKEVIKNFKKSGSRYLLVTTHSEQEVNNDIEQSGQWRKINFEKPPFNFLKPIVLIQETSNKLAEQEEFDKCLGLWLLEDIVI